MAILSLIALLLAIVLSCIKPKINIGLVSICFAMIIGVTGGLKVKEITTAFPSDLFVMLVSICLLLNMANQNGTLDRITNYALCLIKNKITLLPILFFILALTLSAVGPGNIASVALLAPIAMSIAYRNSISPLLMAIMVCTGANAGAFSPIAPTGIINTGLINKIGITGNQIPMVIFLSSAAIQSISALLAYFLFKNYHQHTHKMSSQSPITKCQPLKRMHILTILTLLILVIGVVTTSLPIGLLSLTLALILAFTQVGDMEKAVHNLPWETILMVSGVTILVGLLDKTGALDLATTVISRYAGENIINPVLAFVTGLISAYSSSSGVVLPAFIPLLPGLATKIAGSDIVKMAIAVAVGSHMVDVSPLSTLGAMTIASHPDQGQRKKLFYQLLAWGLSMSVLGGVLAGIFLS